MAMKPISQSVPFVMGKTFERKYIALGRIVTQWKEIVGPEMAARAQPAKLHYRKPKEKGGKATASLDIGASSADCALLVYQKDLILERINRLFGAGWITDIKFVHVDPKPVKKARKTKDLTENDQKYLSEVLEAVEDPAIKERLTRLGQAVLQEKRT